MRRWMAAGVPLLGVCLGGQQLARALGGETAKLEPAEIGWYPIHLSAEAQDDPLFGGEPRELVAYQSHRHRFGLPPGAVPLASSDLCLQAFRHGDRTWALQFHPEVTMEILERWFQLYVDDVDAHRIGFDTPSVRAACHGHLPHWQGVGVRVAERFLALAGSHAASRAAA
jgi:GMP synthase-like glutamine amidotransferase